MPIAVAVAGIAVSAWSARKAAKAQEKAAEKTAEIAEDQYQETRSDNLKMYEQQRLDYTPYREVGTASIKDLATRSAPDGEFSKDYERTAFEVDPGYLYRQAEGEQAINRATAARGGWNSGATLKALARFNSGLASQEYGAWDQRQNTRESQFNQNREFRRNNLASLAGIGQTATAGTAQAGQQAQGQINQASRFNAGVGIESAMNAGEARASGYVGMGNAIGSGIRQWYNGNQQGQYLNGSPPPRAGGAEIANWQNWGA